MYDGPTGTNLIPSTCNTTGTLWEYPLVADVDNDGQADIVVASNAYGITCPDDGSKQSGIRIFGSASGSWVRTRRIWNEHTYHITNISEDGKVPAVEPPNWTQPGLNDYRQNRQPGSVFARARRGGEPRRRSAARPTASSPRCRTSARRRCPPGVVVGFYAGDAAERHAARPGDDDARRSTRPRPRTWCCRCPARRRRSPSGTTPVYAVVDDGMPAHTWHECRTDNDTSAAVSGKCSGVQ